MTIECDEGVGWQNADLSLAAGWVKCYSNFPFFRPRHFAKPNNHSEPVRVFRLQIAILNTHLNGRDTHVRQIKVYSVLP